jgi:hypothetical protein
MLKPLLLDQNGEAIIASTKDGLRKGALASGFRMRVDAVLYLYTCGHVVSKRVA